jgi:triosephosphate isomerase (TIM)
MLTNKKQGWPLPPLFFRMLQFTRMSHTNNPIVIANWKMNPGTLTEAKTIAKATAAIVKKYPKVSVVVAAPHLYITELKKVVGKNPLHVGAQNCHFDVRGAYTGEHSATQLRDIGCSYVIIGHSERRKQGETDELIAKKVQAAITAKLYPVICVGEEARDTQGNFYTLIEKQIKVALAGLPKSRLKDVIIAYEPIWAIGTGATATASDVEEMQMFIKKILTKHFDRNVAKQVRVVYGGSVNAENAADLYIKGGVSGFLVGGASLKPVDFAKIVASVK